MERRLQRSKNNVGQINQPNMGYVGAAMFNNGVDNLAAGTEGVADSLGENRESKRQQNMAQTLLGLNQREEQLGQVNGQPVAGAVGSQAGENLYDFQKRGASALLLAGANPTEAAGMMKIKTASDLAQRDYGDSRADELFKQTLDRDKLTEDTRYHKAIEGDFSINSDDRGNTWKLNKNTGEREKLSSGSGINPKNIQLVPVTTRDGLGVETTEYVPVDKTTGKRVGGVNADGTNTGNVSGTKSPTLSQKDKDFTKNYGTSSDVANRVKDTFSDTGLWGGLDAITGKVGQFFNTDEGNKQGLLNQDLSELRLGITSRLSGVLSDKDMQVLLDTIPQVSDQPEVAQQKLKKTMELTGKAEATELSRLYESNSELIQPLYQEMESGNKKVPYGYDLQRNNSTGQYRLVPKG